MTAPIPSPTYPRQAPPRSPDRPGPLAITAIPDPRPLARHWHQSSATGPRMAPLPLEEAAPPAGADPSAAEFEACQAYARSLLGALVDAIQGRRPAAQLTRWVSAEVMADLTLRARLAQRCPLPLVVRSVHVQMQDCAAGPEGEPLRVVEVAGRLQTGDRFTAVALRLERVGARWFCPVVDFGPPAISEGVRPG